MRSLPMLLRLADEMKRLTMSTTLPAAFNAAFMEDPWSHYRSSVWNQLTRLQREEAVPKIGKNGYQVSLDVGGFKPNELSVKSINDNIVVIEGKSEEHEEDHGSYISKHFVRKYALPNGFDANKALPTLSSDGVLTINVPNPQEFESPATERVIPIQQTGPAHLNIKENPAVEEPSQLQAQQIVEESIPQHQPMTHQQFQRQKLHVHQQHQQQQQQQQPQHPHPHQPSPFLPHLTPHVPQQMPQMPQTQPIGPQQPQRFDRIDQQHDDQFNDQHPDLPLQDAMHHEHEPKSCDQLPFDHLDHEIRKYH